MANKVNVHVDFLYNVYFMQMEIWRLNPWKVAYYILHFNFLNFVIQHLKKFFFFVIVTFEDFLNQQNSFLQMVNSEKYLLALYSSKTIFIQRIYWQFFEIQTHRKR